MTKFRRYRIISSVLFASLFMAALPTSGHAEELPVAKTQISADASPAAEQSVTGKAEGGIAKFTDHASQVALQAVGMLGIHYKYGGNTPENGLDCSGLVRYVYKEAWGKTLPRTAAEMSRVGQSVDPHELHPGDLVFYNTLKRGFSHVGIYLGENKFVHSPSTGGQVRIESMDLSYWKSRFSGARRIDEPEILKNTQ